MAHDFYVSVKAQKAGQFKGEATVKGQASKIVGREFECEVSTPADVATGQASGKRRHKPIRFIKALDGTSPQFFNALVSHDILTEVVFEFLRTDAKGGGEIVYYTIKLTNAWVSTIRILRKLEEGTGDETHASRFSHQELEEISIVFQKIEVENKVAKTMAQDDWNIK